MNEDKEAIFRAGFIRGQRELYNRVKALFWTPELDFPIPHSSKTAAEHYREYLAEGPVGASPEGANPSS